MVLTPCITQLFHQLAKVIVYQKAKMITRGGLVANLFLLI